MHRLDVPAGSRVRLIATAREGTDLHRWDLRVMAAGDDGPPRLVFGSRIGHRDRDQRIDIPSQDVDCRIDICSRHRAHGGWEDDICTVQDDTPDELRIGFCTPGAPGSHADDVLLSFAISTSPRPSDEEKYDGQRPEAI